MPERIPRAAPEAAHQQWRSRPVPILIGPGGRDYTSRMSLPDLVFLETHLGSVLVAIAALAVVLGVAANLVAARLLLGLGRAANDPVYRRTYRTPVRRTPGSRAHLHLAA